MKVAQRFIAGVRITICKQVRKATTEMAPEFPQGTAFSFAILEAQSHETQTLSRPFHGLGIGSPALPAINRWAISGRPLRGLCSRGY
jgi:hypothetical protein